MFTKNKTIVLTGSNRGIGKELLIKFAKNKYNIYACARKKNDDFEREIRALENEYNVWIKPVYFDLSNEEQIKDGMKEILEDRQRIDVLVNNAGIPFGASFQMTSPSKLKEVFQINYFAQIQIMQMISRVMIKQKSGSIINMVSVGGIEAEPGYLAYGSSKAALIWATRCLAKEIGPYGIRVNAVAPGLTDTNMGYYKSEEELNKVLERTPLGRMAQPEEIAEMVLFLASDKSAYITGQIIQVDGGRRI